MGILLGAISSQGSSPSLIITYPNSYFTYGLNNEVISPSIVGGDGLSLTYSYSGTLPTGVTYNTSTGEFTGPSTASWKIKAKSMSLGPYSFVNSQYGDLYLYNTPYNNNQYGQSNIPSNILFQQIVTTKETTCGLTTSGGVKCWGRNDVGQLGNGSTTNSTTPVDVVGLESGVVSISGYSTFFCAVTTSGTVKCWGYNQYGQLGDGSSTNRSTPVNVSGLTSVSSISCGDQHACAVTTSGGVKCWGYNQYGQLGDGSSTSRSTPVDVSGLTSGVSSVSCAYRHTSAVTTSGGAKSWGDNYSGKLGDGSSTTRYTPVDVSGLTSGVSSVSCGHETTSFLLTNGQVKTCGSGYTSTPEYVVGISNAISIASTKDWVGGNISFSCILDINYELKCWGTSKPDETFLSKTRAQPGFPSLIDSSVSDGGTNSSSESIELDIFYPPGAVSLTGYFNTSNEIILSWEDPLFIGTSPISSYRVEYSPNSPESWTTVSTNQTSKTATIGGFSPGLWKFRVYANSLKSGSINPGVPAVFSKILYDVPSEPINLSTSSGINSITLSWDAPVYDGMGITDYIIQTSSDNINWTTLNDGISTTRSYTLSGLSNNQTVYFRVAASNPSFTGNYSSSISGTSLNPKASGGTITYLNGYYYHTFYANDTFTPTTSILATAYVVAGGYDGSPGNGNTSSGAGGAGGKVVSGTQTISTARTITVGSNNGGTSSISGWLSASGAGAAGGAGRSTPGTGNNGSPGVSVPFPPYMLGPGGGGGAFSDATTYFWGGNAGNGSSGFGAGGFSYGIASYNYAGTVPEGGTGMGGGGGAASTNASPAAGGSALNRGGVVIIYYPQ